MDLAAQLEALQHENETLHRQNLTLQSALVVRSSESVLQTAPRSAPDPTVSTSGQARSYKARAPALSFVQPGRLQVILQSSAARYAGVVEQ